MTHVCTEYRVQNCTAVQNTDVAVIIRHVNPEPGLYIDMTRVLQAICTCIHGIVFLLMYV